MTKTGLTRDTGRTAISGSASSNVSVPESLLPEQYFGGMGWAARETPERRLMFAVLLDALTQLRRSDSRQVAEAERWIRGEDGDNWPFSFFNVCGALGIEPGYLAHGLLDERGRVRLPAPRLRVRHHRVRPLRRRRRRAAVA